MTPATPAAQDKTIVVGVDGEGHSDPAVHAAFELAQRLGAKVELVHAASVPHRFWSHVDEQALAGARAATLARLGKHLARAGFQVADLDRRLSVLPGPPARALLERAQQVKASVLVLGPHHRHGLLDFEDTVRSVVARSTCPVWIQPLEPTPIRRVLVPVDFSDESRAALALGRDLALAFGAALSTLHCFVRPELGFVLGYPVPFPPSVIDSAKETAQSEYEALLGAFDWKGVTHEAHFVEAEPAAEILERQTSHELIVMGTHGKTGLSAAVMGSVAQSVMRDAKRPVVATR
jgi:nucleotide-binding universal stress UspA family protein